MVHFGRADRKPLLAASAFMAALAVLALAGVASMGPQSAELLELPVPSQRLISSYPSTLKKLGEAALDEISKMPGLSSLDNMADAEQAEQGAGFKQRRARFVAGSPMLSEDPDVSSYIYFNEMGNWDGVWGPDNGYIPRPANEDCTDGVCYQDYARYAKKLHPHGFVMPKQKLKQMRLMGAALKGKGKAVRTQQLGEISDFPDIEEDQEIKDAKQTVKDLFGPFEPLESQLNRFSEEDKKDYADFYRAYAAYQLPHEVSNQGPGRPWKAENLNLGGGDLPPYGYPYSPAYYPAGPAKAAVTINANGQGSQNTFHVAGPQSINVNIGVSGAGAKDEDDNSYIYPDGLTQVIPAFAQPTAETTTTGGPVIEQDKANGDAAKEQGAEGSESEGAQSAQDAMKEEEEQIGEQEALGITSNLCSVGNPDCNFWQDAYDDAYW